MQNRDTNDDIYIHVGQRILVRRALMGMSRELLASKIDRSVQQLRRYENGTCKTMTADRLQIIADALGVQFEYFFISVDV